MNYTACCSLPRSRSCSSPSLKWDHSPFCPHFPCSAALYKWAANLFSVCSGFSARQIRAEELIVKKIIQWVPQLCPEELFHCPLAGHNLLNSGWEIGAFSPKDPPPISPLPSTSMGRCFEPEHSTASSFAHPENRRLKSKE